MLISYLKREAKKRCNLKSRFFFLFFSKYANTELLKAFKITLHARAILKTVYTEEKGRNYTI